MIHVQIQTSILWHFAKRILKKNEFLEDDIDAPLQSGIVRIFNQSDIEASTDGDGFVEIRYKRKMTNEWRGLRKRETNPEYKALVRKANP
ncbi:hypothetical protein IEQ34_007193 [Dendrobium chrysotoxum]|uniref:Uncharacterized protein n=1 Tax=Dendrobium chrysotoxum TaxID=161865 RepID=A0AAV7H7K9_DENCH|nr:hypothetical protein IEQ34_007193 [Dendrobium chrysotoxum]